VGRDILTYDDLLQIVELIKSAEAFSEFHLKVGDIELDLRKASGATSSGPAVPTAAPPPGIPAPREGAASAAATPAVKSKAVRSRAELDIPPHAVVIAAPMTGTFYRKPEPTAKPFVAVGDRVHSNTTVCIIEVMKLMNSIPAGCDGTVTHVLVDDAAPIELGQLLMVIEPASP
jgi:acetyl-CoA carboxylase biotin carboxyl carrier protein